MLNSTTRGNRSSKRRVSAHCQRLPVASSPRTTECVATCPCARRLTKTGSPRRKCSTHTEVSARIISGKAHCAAAGGPRAWALRRPDQRAAVRLPARSTPPTPSGRALSSLLFPSAGPLQSAIPLILSVVRMHTNMIVSCARQTTSSEAEMDYNGKMFPI